MKSSGTELCPACGVRPGFGRPPTEKAPRKLKSPDQHQDWWMVCGCGGRLAPTRRPYSYRQVIQAWNARIGRAP